MSRALRGAISIPADCPFIRECIETMDNQAPVIESPIVSPEYFHLFGMPLLRGRLFSEQDTETTPQVAVINQATSRTYWPNQDPVGSAFVCTWIPAGSRALASGPGPRSSALSQRVTFDFEAAEHLAQILARTEKIGRKTPAPDAYIAAIAMTRGFAVATRHVDHFRDTGVSVINPWD
jgi:MacB-like periplasmic core domain